MTLFKHELVGGVGLPIAENPTGIMHEAAFAEVGINWRYLLLEVGKDGLQDLVRGMKVMGFRGANFTIPHKVAIMEHLDAIGESAKLIGAVNTVRVDSDGRWIGENTDGKGFMTALNDAGIDVRGKRVVILGAGGAARAITVELALAGVGPLTIVNRSEARALPLQHLLQTQTSARVEFVRWAGTYQLPSDTDILVNASSIGLFPSEERPNIEYDLISPAMVVCDVVPNPPRTPFLLAASERGARTVDGLGMLIAQGALAFEMWTGKVAPRQPMLAALSKGLGLV